MNLKNITLKTAELGPVSWENVEKLQPGECGFIFFISAETKIVEDETGEYTILVGTYIPTTFDKKPTYKQLINYIIQCEYPDGKEAELLRFGIYDPEDKEFLDYYNNVEDICATVKNLL